MGSAAGLKEHRHGGASAGGWLSFELALKGESRTLESYLSYGLLEEENPLHFLTILTAVELQVCPTVYTAVRLTTHTLLRLTMHTVASEASTYSVLSTYT